MVDVADVVDLGSLSVRPLRQSWEMRYYYFGVSGEGRFFPLPLGNGLITC